MHFLALDIGSSFIKGAVLDAEKLTIEHVTRVPFPQPIAGLPAGHLEIEPRRVMVAVCEALNKLLAQTPDCRGIFFSSQMGGVILTKPGSFRAPLPARLRFRRTDAGGDGKMTRAERQTNASKHFSPFAFIILLP